MKDFRQKDTLYVFSTGRKINEFYRTCGDGFLPKALSIGEFFSTIVFVPFLKKIPLNARKVFLINVISQAQNLSNTFVFRNNFLAYLESSSFLFDFFDEITAFDIDFAQIPQKDIYGDYREHLQVLFEIYEKYCNKLKEYGFYDVLKKDEYKILKNFFYEINSIEFYLDGFLKTQEEYILHQISQWVPVHLHIITDRYSIKHFGRLLRCQEKFSSKNPYILESDFSYKINLLDSKILEKTKLINIGKIELFSFASRMNQCALVLERANAWLQANMDPKKVAVIVPDEGFIKYLKLLDTNNNLNFAMGEVLEQIDYIKSLKKELKNLKDAVFIADTKPLKDQNPKQMLKKSLQWLETLCEHLLNTSKDKKVIKPIHDEIIFSYKQIEEEISKFLNAEILELYLQDFSKKRIDDISGGKISVMGVLESRGLSFEQVIIVDFNEAFIPNLKDSDMFLNTAIRKSLDIPTLADRQDLQKHYYLQILRNTSKIDITFVENNNSTHSKMLDEMGILTNIKNGDDHYRLFPIAQKKPYMQEQFIKEIPNNFIFSSSSLSVLLSCKRKFYFRYLIKLFPRDKEGGALEIGAKLHELLREIYMKYKNNSIDIKVVKRNFEDLAKTIHLDSQKDQLDFEIALSKMDAFWKKEGSRIEEGLRVLECEKEFCTKIEGFNFKGRIDRIDESGNKIVLIDYKKKKNSVDTEKTIEETIDFQFPIYVYGARSLGYVQNIVGYFYDLANGEFLEEKTLELKLEALLEKLKKLKGKINFEMTQNKNICQNCDFSNLCGL